MYQATGCDYLLDTEPQRPCGRPASKLLVYFHVLGEFRQERHPRCHRHFREKAARAAGWVVAEA